MLRALLTTLAVLAFPAGASAAPFGELPFQSAGGAAACLRPTGAPGEVVRWVRGGVQTMTARADGLHPTGGARLGTYWTCPVVASDPNGAAVLVVGLMNREAVEWDGLRVVVREPGAPGWSAPVTVPAKAFDDVEVAVSARGDAVIAWLQYTTADEEHGEVRAVRRAPGEGFGAVETLAAFDSGFGDGVAVGMSADGETTVAYNQPRGRRNDVVVRSASPGARFGAPRTLAANRDVRPPALAVASDGRALVVAGGLVYERPPGGAFGPAQTLDRDQGFGSSPVVALRADGAAVVAYVASWQAPTVAFTRGAPGVFGPPVELAPAHPPLNDPIGFGAVAPESNPPVEPYPEPTVTLGADGRALLVRAADERNERDQRRPLAITFPVAGAFAAIESTTLGGPVRDAAGFAPVVLADGRFAVAWTDDRGSADTGARDGRLHLAFEGAVGFPEAAVPAVTVGTPRPRAVRPAQAVRLPVRCSAACDVRAVVAGHPHGFDFTGSLARAGTLQLPIRPANTGLASSRGRMRLTLHVSAPGGRTTQRRTVSVALRRLPAPRLPRVLDLRARRRGDAIVVRWRLDGPLRDAYQFVFGSRGPRLRGDGIEIGETRRLGGGVFQARVPRAARLRYVHVQVFSFLPARNRTVRLAVPFR